MCAEVEAGTITAPLQGGAWTLAYAWNGGENNNISCYYTKFGSSVSSITATIGTSQMARTAWYWEFSSSLSGISWIMDAASFTLHGSCTNCAGQSLTLSGTNDAMLQLFSAHVATTGITTYSDFISDTTRGGADLINTASGVAPTWTNDATTDVVVGAIAISEATPGPANCFPGDESGCPSLCPNTGSLAPMPGTLPPIDCVRGITYSRLAAPNQPLTVSIFAPHDVDPQLAPIVYWCGGAFTSCVDSGGTITLDFDGKTTAYVLLAEATRRPVYVPMITQAARCWLHATAPVGATTLSVSCTQSPAAPFSFWIDFQTDNAEHLTCDPCRDGAAWTLTSPTNKIHTSSGGFVGSNALILPDATAPPRPSQDSDCFGRWFGVNGGTPSYPGDPLAMHYWSFSSGSTMAALLMPSAAGAFPSSCDNAGQYKIASSFLMALPADLAASYQYGTGSASQTAPEEYLGCRLDPGSACEAYSKRFSPIDYVHTGNPLISLMSGALGDDITVPPFYNEVPFVLDYAAIGVTIPWLALTGTPDYHAMDCSTTPLWSTNCLQQTIRFFEENP